MLPGKAYSCVKFQNNDYLCATQNHSKMKELVEKIKAAYAEFEKGATAQVEKGNKAAGTRARKAALEISKLMKDFRKASVEEAK